LACADSRVPVEAIFSQDAGSLFVVRVAGNVVAASPLGSLEFAVLELGVPLVLVMGHSGCGAVAAALAAAGEGPPSEIGVAGHLPALLDPVIGALDRRASTKLRDGSLDSDEAVRLNVMGACEDLIQQSGLLASKVEAGELLVAGSVYDLRTGRVEFLEQ
jgi:carbonic anhydrase